MTQQHINRPRIAGHHLRAVTVALVVCGCSMGVPDAEDHLLEDLPKPEIKLGTADNIHPAPADDISVVSQAALLPVGANFTHWTQNGYVVPVCWITAGFANPKQWTKDIVEEYWQGKSGLTFTGWNNCPTSGTDKYIRVKFESNGPGTGSSGGSGIGMLQTLLAFNEKNPADPSAEIGTSMTLRPGDTAPQANFQQVAIHEFQHALGFHHEELRPDSCSPSTLGWNETTPFDRWSVNSEACRPTPSAILVPSGRDTLGFQGVYGPGQSWDHTTRNFCKAGGETLYQGDFNGDGRTDLLCNNVANGWMFVEIASSSGQFIWDGADWSGLRNFCTGSGDNLYIGDFNGDGRDDILCNHTTSGAMDIDYASSTGQLTATDWTHSTRNYCRTSSEKMYVGKFNSDSRSDLLCNNVSSGDMYIDYANSNGQFWGTGWWHTARNFCRTPSEFLHVGDVNGDGRDDLICNNVSNGSMFVDRASTSGQFTSSDWSQNRGFCQDGNIAVGDMNGDNRTDLVCWRPSSGELEVVLAHAVGSFPKVDATGAPESDLRAPFGGWCTNSTSRFVIGRFDSGGGITGGSASKRADILCNRSSGHMSIRHNMEFPVLSERNVFSGGGVWHEYGPYFVPTGRRVTALLADRGGSGDADLYTRWGQLPTTSSFDCRPYSGESTEACAHAGSGQWLYVSVRSYSGTKSYEIETYFH